MKTKVVGLDVYGTMLSTSSENLPKRKGLDSLLERCKRQGLILCTCSDGKTEDVKRNLSEAEVNLKYFNRFFEMPRTSEDFTRQPKDFTPILEYYSKKINLIPSELLIIGDREVRDIIPAKELGCNAILVPEYRTNKEYNDFDINDIIIP